MRVERLGWLAVVIALFGCGKGTERQAAAASAESNAALLQKQEDAAKERERQAELDREWPIHGLVTGLQMVVHKDADPASMAVGWLRVGSRIRLRGEPTKTATCASGWYSIMPLGYVCVGEGIAVGSSPPKAEFEVPPPARDAALPYSYWVAKDDFVAEYHRLPSRDEQREAAAFAKRYFELRTKTEAIAEKFRRGELPGDMPKPSVVYRFLDRGFFVAAAGVEERAFRKFVRTGRGRYIKQSELEPREGSGFEGFELGTEHKLPLVWAVRAARPLIRRDRADGTVKFVEDAAAPVFERQKLVAGWLGKTNIEGTVYHRLDGDRYVKDWFFAVAEQIPKPREIKKGEPWVHVDLSSQTLVLYREATPVFATLVSSGLDGFNTQPGMYTVSRKYVADTMANLGDTMDNRYSIEDVPWTQYFQGSFALHGAFWHGSFGLQRSHGCVNLAPRDAHRLFNELWPTIPDGWLGVVADLTSFPESHVVITP